MNRVNGGHGGLSRRGERSVREGLLEEGGPTVDRAVLGGTPHWEETGVLLFFNFVDHGEVAHREDERHSLRDVCNGEDVFEAGEGLEWARSAWS